MQKAPSPARTHIGIELRKARQSQEKNQAQIAKKAGYTAAELSRWERGDRMPTVPQIVRLAKALNVDVAKLLMFAAKGVVKERS